MNRNLYTKEIKRNRKTLTTWTSIVIAFTVLVMSIFPYMKDVGNEMATMLNKMPEGMLLAMGINDQTFINILAMYNTYYGIYIIVLLSIFSASTGATIISKEEKNKTAEFLMSKPISRKSIYNTKLLSLFTLTFTAYTVQTIVAIIFVIFHGKTQVRWSVFATMHIHGLTLILLFTCIGVFVSMLLNPKINFMGITVGIVFGSYFLNAISKVADAINWIGFISPFYYLDFNVTDPNYNTNYFFVIYMLLFGILLLFVSYKIYIKKDIST